MQFYCFFMHLSTFCTNRYKVWIRQFKRRTFPNQFWSNNRFMKWKINITNFGENSLSGYFLIWPVGGQCQKIDPTLSVAVALDDWDKIDQKFGGIKVISPCGDWQIASRMADSLSGLAFSLLLTSGKYFVQRRETFLEHF